MLARLDLDLRLSRHCALTRAAALAALCLPATAWADHQDGWRPIELAVPLAIAAVLSTLLWWLLRRRRQQELLLLAEIREREARLNLALWGSGDEFWDWNIRENTLYRLGANQLLGRSIVETMSTDEWRQQAIHPDDLPRVQKLLQEHIVGNTEQYDSEHRIRNAAGEWVWVRSRGKLVERDENGSPLRMAGTARDVSQLRNAERERRVAVEVLRSMNEAVAVIDTEYRFVSVNPAFTRITGYGEQEVLRVATHILNSSQHSSEFFQHTHDILERTGHWAGEMWQKHKNNDDFLAWIELNEVRDNVGVRSHFVAVLSDITDTKRAEQELRYLANYDALTGLPNRTLLSERLGRAVLRARRQGSRVAVLFIDLDRFKDINDSLGHAAGDRLLKAAAFQLQATVGMTETVARLGGDEFTIVLEDVDGLAAVEKIARDILAAFALPLDRDDRHELSITPSLGISLYPDHAQTPSDLLRFADTAMYQAKAEGRNTYQVYNEEMDAEARKRTTLLASFRRASERGELSLHLQPRLRLSDDIITGVEALLRWHSAELGEVPPSVFIPLAEESGLIVPIGDWVISEACRILRHWRDQGLTELSIGINISVLQLLRGNLVDTLRAALLQHEVPANRIELEVTESMVMQNAQQATEILNQLRDLGVTLAIDDFGTGHSSLVYLKRLPIHMLKIDKEFIADIHRDPDDAAITATIIAMGHSLGLVVVAEGVETEQQLQFLRRRGCDQIQGYWLSRPLVADDCLAFLRGWQPNPEVAG